jgi:transcriptional regulator with XRE-family HTH domain
MAFTRQDRLIGIGQFTKWYMERRDLSYRQLAAKLECSSGYISQVTADSFLFPTKFIKRLKTILTNEEAEIMLEAVNKDINAWYYADEQE